MAAVPDIEDAPELLAAMMADSAASGPFWQPTAYWRGYADRIHRELKTSGLRNLRTNQRLLKGFASGGVLVPTEPAAPWKRAVWRSVSAAPLVRRIIAEHRRVGSVAHADMLQHLKAYARNVLEEIARRFPDFTPPRNMAAAGAEDCFDWNGQQVGAYWVLFLARTADFYAAIPQAEVRTVLEIGPGLGLTTLAHLALNPNLRVVYNVDISPVAYISTQFLKTCPDITVVDYLETRDQAEIPHAPGEKPVVYQLMPWQMPRIASGVADFGFNAFSFQEMERDTCANYAQEIMRITTLGMMLHSSLAGHVAGAGGQKAPVSLAYLVSLFSAKYPLSHQVGGLWPTFYAGHGADIEQTALLRPAEPG